MKLLARENFKETRARFSKLLDVLQNHSSFLIVHYNYKVYLSRELIFVPIPQLLKHGIGINALALLPSTQYKSLFQDIS